MSKILIEGSKVIIDGHANDLETCNTLTNLCYELSTSDKFRTVKYESGYGEFESVSESGEKKFAPSRTFEIYSNDGSLRLAVHDQLVTEILSVVEDGVISNNTGRIYTYSGDKIFKGLTSTKGSSNIDFPVGSDKSFTDLVADIYYIVEADPGYQVNIQSNDSTATLAQNATVDSVVVTAAGAQLKCGDAVKATYTYSGSKLFAGLSTSANSVAAEYKPGDTIKITAETTLYIVENIIIPEHHSSLNELFTNIATVIREKTGMTDSIAAAEFPSMIRNRLEVIPPPVPYLTFSSPSSFTIKTSSVGWDGILEYSSDTDSWSTWDGTTISSIANGSEYILYLRGAGNTMISSQSGYVFNITGTDVRCNGSIETLLDYSTVESGNHPTMANYCYTSMFYGCTALTQAPALPATTLANSCYSQMFYGCSNLTQAPALPATTLESECYSSMFRGCTALTQAPALPATTLTGNCYSQMFYGCSNLTQAPALPATTLANSCYYSMFSGCTSLTQAPALPATTLAERCYYYMFRGCTGLTQAPALPATTLAERCYNGMFLKCTALTKAPSNLPATTLAERCYAYMFEFTAITAIPRIMAKTYATDSCKGMFDDIKTLNVYSRSGTGHTYGWTAPASTYCSGMFGSDDSQSEWAKLDGSNFPNSGTPTEGVTYYFATVD